MHRMHPHLIHAIILQSYNRGGRDIIVKKVTNFLPVIFQVLMEANGLLHKKNNNNKKKGNKSQQPEISQEVKYNYEINGSCHFINLRSAARSCGEHWKHRGLY